MVIRNVSARNITLRDSIGTIYAVPAYGTVSLDDALWDDTEFRRWVRYRIRDIAVTTTVAGISPKEPVRATTVGSNITLSGIQTLDGVVLVANDRVLVKDQTDATTNGIYTVKGGAWVRSADANDATDLIPNMFNFVSEGTVNHDTGWVLTTDAPIILGTTPLTWVQFTGPFYEVITDPNASSRNVIQPLSDATALTVKNTTGTQTADILQWVDKNNVVEGRITKTGRIQSNDGVTTKTVAGVPADGSFAATPADGTLAIDTANNQFYFRSNNAWLSTDNVSGPSYIIYKSGSTYFAQNPSGVTVTSNADAAAVLTSILPAANSSGAEIVFADGTYAWSSVPALPKGITTKLRIRGSAATVITLSSSGPRFLDFNKTADYDTFQNIELANFTIDCNNVGGRHHVILGTYIAGVVTNRISVQDIYLHDITTINVPVDSTVTNHRLNIWLGVNHIATGETQTNLVRLRFERIRMVGGNQGIFIGGAGPASNGVNVFFDEIDIHDCWHSLLSYPTVGYSSANYQVGSRGWGGKIRISRCYGQFSGDVGVELDGYADAVITNCTMEDARNISYYQTNFNNLESIAGQRVLYEGCVSVRTSASAGGTNSNNFAWKTSAQTPANAMGSIVLKNCKLYRNNTDWIQPGELFYTTNNCTLIELIQCKVIIEGISTGASNTNPGIIYIGNAVTCPVHIRDLFCSLSGTRGGAGVVTFDAIDYEAASGYLDINGFDWTDNITGMNSAGIRLIDLGQTGPTAGTVSIKGLRMLNVGSDTTPRGIVVRGTTTFTPDRVIIEDSDFSTAPGGVAEILFTGASGADNKSKVYTRNVRYRSNWPTSPRSTSTNYTLLFPNDEIVLANATAGAITITLPDAIGMPKGRSYTIKRISTNANNVTVATTSSQTIDGSTTYVITNPRETITVISDGTNWQMI